MVNFDKIIDECNENQLREFHRKLIDNKCYDGLLNVSEIDQNDLDKIREAIKVGVQGAGYETLKQIGPESIRKEIEGIDNTPVIVPPETAMLESADTQETKEQLIQEVLSILELRQAGKGVPAKYRDRYGEILTKLSEEHNMTFNEISEVISINNKTVAKSIEQYKEKHPINRPDEALIKKAETKTEATLTKVITARADQLIESDMELAIHIREKYLKKAYMRGISLMELVDTAVPIFLNIENIYDMMMQQERENISLKQNNKILTSKIIYLETVNDDLNRALLSINQ